jgi:hypothetical protein
MAKAIQPLWWIGAIGPGFDADEWSRFSYLVAWYHQMSPRAFEITGFPPIDPGALFMSRLLSGVQIGWCHVWFCRASSLSDLAD